VWDLKLTHAAFEACVRLYPNEHWRAFWAGKTVGVYAPGKGGWLREGPGV